MKKRMLAMAVAEVLISLSLLSGCGNDTATGSTSYAGASESSSRNEELSENGSGDDRIISDIISDNKQILKSVYDEYDEPRWMNLGIGGSELEINWTMEENTVDEMGYVIESIETIVERIGLPDTLSDDITNASPAMGYQSEIFIDQTMKVEWVFTENQQFQAIFTVLTSEEVGAAIWEDVWEENN